MTPSQTVGARHATPRKVKAIPPCDGPTFGGYRKVSRRFRFPSKDAL